MLGKGGRYLCGPLSQRGVPGQSNRLARLCQSYFRVGIQRSGKFSAEHTLTRYPCFLNIVQDTQVFQIVPVGIKQTLAEQSETDNKNALDKHNHAREEVRRPMYFVTSPCTISS